MGKIISHFLFTLLVSVSIANGAVIKVADYGDGTCSNINIDSAIFAASSGDTIEVPAGRCQWRADVEIPGSKDLIIQGQGIGVTTVYSTEVGGIHLDMTESRSRITGFTFQEIWITSQGDGFRVDHNRFYSATVGGRTGFKTAPIVPHTYEMPYGLVDNNQFYNGRIVIYGGPLMANTQWTLDTDLGGDNNVVYIEDNTFIRTISPTGNAVDGNQGGAYVFRYNTVNGNYLEAHSIQGNNRAHKKWEIYGNIIEINPSVISFYATRPRGGTGVIFGNFYKGNWKGRYIGFDNKRSYDAFGDGGKCDGDSAWDGNEDGTGYPCRDQIGRGSDMSLWVASPAGAYTQALEPAYLWSNTHDTGNVMADVINSSGGHIQANRDYYEYITSFDGTSGTGCGTLASRPATCITNVGYWATNQSCTDMTGMVGARPSIPISGTLYKCTSKDSWTEYFTPYTYPHPLTKSGSIAPTPLGFRPAK